MLSLRKIFYIANCGTLWFNRFFGEEINGLISSSCCDVEVKKSIINTRHWYWFVALGMHHCSVCGVQEPDLADRAGKCLINTDGIIHCRRRQNWFCKFLCKG